MTHIQITFTDGILVQANLKLSIVMKIGEQSPVFSHIIRGLEEKYDKKIKESKCLGTSEACCKK